MTALRTNKMALYYELPVYRDVYKLNLMIFEYTKDLSKEYKYTLEQDINRGALQLVRNIWVNTGKAIFDESMINTMK